MKNKKFKSGTYCLNAEPNFNYQLNRTIMWSDGDLEEIKEISHKIISTETWVSEMTKLAKQAIRNDYVEKAIAYYRMSEFFEFDGGPEKLKLYRKSRELFYRKHKTIFNTVIKRDYVNYENVKLPVWINTDVEENASKIIIHGGNDSYIEEFLPVMRYFSENNIKAYLFEGPGQGEVLREFGMPLTHMWEKPVKCILDTYGLQNVTIIGISLGGMLASRAAAYESRIKRVVSWSILPDFLNILISTRDPFLQRLLRFLLKMKFNGVINFLLKRQMQKDPMAKWGILHGMHNMGAESVSEYFLKAGKFQMLDVAEKIKQDYLLLGAKNDHFIPLEMYKDVIDSLGNVRSLTFRIFTEHEKAENHCNAGNTELALRTIVNWIHQVSE